MFYFDELNGYKILRSDYIKPAEKDSEDKIADSKNPEQNIKSVDAFFTTREGNPVNSDFASRILSPEQVHSENIEIVDERNEYPETDGLILTELNTTICLRFADCTPLIFYDTASHIGAISHAGWRGTVMRIGVKTVAKMILNYGSKPEDITVIIGPAISKCCYEVSEEVRDALLNTVKNTEGLYSGRNVDLKKINARQLEEIGVKNIDICPYCTSCNNDLFYSYRKENGTTERHYAVLKLT